MMRIGLLLPRLVIAAISIVCVAAVTTAPASAAGESAQHDTGPIVQTTQGRVQGFTKDGLAEFFGIPYAAPPIGNLRWRPPVAHAHWTGVLKATAFGPTCAQIENSPFSGPTSTSEDCLYINVFAPAIADHKKLPVILWSYGGGDFEGESNDYDGSKLALQGHTVVVTFNYRLNLFGFLAHPALDHEGHLFGNYGILDNQFALRWVHDNIAAFGGDAANITIAGQSAGATNVGAEVLSPLDKGLFTRAILQSGAMPTLTPLSVAEAKGVAFAAAAGCGTGAAPAVAQCLRKLPAAKILSFAHPPFVANNIADGAILPKVVIDAFESGKFNHVPLMIGNAEDEGAYFVALPEYSETPRKPITEAQFQAYLKSTYGGNAGPGYSPPAYPAGTIAAVNAHYPLSAFSSPELQWVAVETDGGRLNLSACKLRHVVNILATQTPVYTYEFRDRTAPSYWPSMPGFKFLAYHTGDIQYYWPLYHGGRLGQSHPLNGAQQKLADTLVNAWVNFAQTGNPNGHGEKPWPRYTPNGLYLDEDIGGLSTFSDAQFSTAHQCAFWDKVIVYRSTAQ
jgi:para-nitrobenzyl esterase